MYSSLERKVWGGMWPQHLFNTLFNELRPEQTHRGKSSHISRMQNLKCTPPSASGDPSLICMTVFRVMDFILGRVTIGWAQCRFPPGVTLPLLTLSPQTNRLIQAQPPPCSPRALWEMPHAGLVFSLPPPYLSICPSHMHVNTQCFSFSVSVLVGTPKSPLFGSPGSDTGSHYESEEKHFRASSKGWLS